MNTGNLHSSIVLSGITLWCVLSCLSCREPVGGGMKEPTLDSLRQVVLDSVYSNPEYSQAKLDEAFALAEDSVQFYDLLHVKSQIYFLNNKYDSGFQINARIYDFCKRAPLTPQIHALLGNLENMQGVYYSFTDQVDSALVQYRQAYLHLIQSDQLRKMPDICINFADAYKRKGEYDMSAYYLRRALFLCDSLNLREQLEFPIYFGLGETYMELRDFETADMYYTLAEPQLAAHNLSERFNFCNSRGNFYYYKKEYDKALPWFKKARELVLPTGLDYYINVCEINTGEIYLWLGQLDSARYYLDRSYSYFFRYENKSALFHLATLKAALALKEGKLHEAGKLLSSFTDTAGIAPNMKSIRNESLRLYYESTGDYRQAYRYLQKNVAIDSMLRDERGRKRVAELDMRYKQDTTLIRRDAIIREQSAEVKALKMSSLIWTLVCIILFGLTAFLIFYYKRQRKIQWQKHFGQVTKLKMESIRNRVSPHFIFNVLNREIHARGTNGQGQTELVNLVKLLRASLDITEKLVVPLKEELEFVEVYLGLMEKGMGDDFEVHWQVAPTLDTRAICLPSMLIQIPVENAVKHGLKGKEGPKRLSISIEDCGNSIRITVEDNGGGYYPQASHRDPNSTGTGFKVLYRTIQLLNTKNREKIAFTIRNKEGAGESGAVISFIVPKNYNYAI